MSPDKHRSLIQRLAREDWEEIRRKGRGQFIWWHRVLPLVVPLGITFAIGDFIDLGYSLTDVLSLRLLELTYYILGVTLLVVYIEAFLEWRRNERV